jgi:hypothetical protein
MRKQNDLSARITYRYAPGYDALDEWTESIGKFSVLNARHARGYDDIDSTLTLRVDKSQFAKDHKKPDELIERALISTLTKGCRCEHDCCGHWQTSARDARKVSGKEWIVRVYAYRNV